MSTQKGGKLNQLFKIWPNNTVMTSFWLNKNGFNHDLIKKYERGGWIKRIGIGAYAKISDEIEWQSGVIALQKQLNLPIHIGGKTVFEIKGKGQYIQMGQGNLWLFSQPEIKLPLWFKNYNWNVKLKFHTAGLFASANLGLTELNIKEISIVSSSLERAILEIVSLVPHKQSFEETFQILESLATLRPNLLQKLLKSCNNVKTKRLFMYIAEKIGHPWFNRLDPSKINFGKGKRTIIKGGEFNSKYNITVSKSEHET